jgi:hypothetical protein
MTRSPAIAILMFPAAFLAVSGAGAGEVEGDEDCLKLPASYYFELPGEGRAVGMTIAAGCESPGMHAFILETASKDDEGGMREEILIRFAPGREGQADPGYAWMEKKLLKIKNASTAAGQHIEGARPSWAVAYGKTTQEEKVVPTVALLTALEDAETFATRLFRFPECDGFFSPFVFGVGGSVLAVWGEEAGDGTSSVCASFIHPGKKKAAPKMVLASGRLLDRFHAAPMGGNIFLSWLEEPSGAAGFPTAAVGKFGPTGKDRGRVEGIALGGEAVFTGIRLEKGKTFVDGMEGRKGKWRPFTIKIGSDFEECKVGRKNSPSVGYEASFVRFSEVVLSKNRHEDATVVLEFFGARYDVSVKEAKAPLALSVCESSIVAGWAAAEDGKVEGIRFIDLFLKDSDSDGVLDGFDACHGPDEAVKEE